LDGLEELEDRQMRGWEGDGVDSWGKGGVFKGELGEERLNVVKDIGEGLVFSDCVLDLSEHYLCKGACIF